MTISLNSIVSDLARKNFGIIRVFQKYNIDFYCNGDMTLQEAMGNAKVDFDLVVEELRNVAKEKHLTLFAVDIESWPLDLLADYIQKTHHKFTDAILYEIRNLIAEGIVSNNADKAVFELLQEPFENLSKELGSHMKKEELILFPAIRRMMASISKKERISHSIESPVDQMIHEHSSQDLLMRKIRAILGDYNDNKIHSPLYNEIAGKVQKLDLDLTLHLHLENNILFPKAIDLEFNN